MSRENTIITKTKTINKGKRKYFHKLKNVLNAVLRKNILIVDMMLKKRINFLL